jgi:hypothetical protein
VGISVIVMILKGVFVNSIEKEQASLLVQTYYGRKLISFSLKKSSYCFARFRLLVWLGIYSVQENPIDAIPDLSENQVIVFRWMGRSPQVIEDQVTYPLVSNLQGVPKVKISGLLPCLG